MGNGKQAIFLREGLNNYVLIYDLLRLSESVKLQSKGSFLEPTRIRLTPIKHLGAVVRDPNTIALCQDFHLDPIILTSDRICNLLPRGIKLNCCVGVVVPHAQTGEDDKDALVGPRII